MFSKKVIVKKYYTLEVPHIKIFKFIDNIYQYNDYGLRLECCPVYDPQEEVNVVNIYTISSDVIRSEYKEDIYTSGDIVNFQNFGNALVIWRNAYDHCYIKTLDMEKIIHRVNGVYVEFNGVNISKHSSLLVTYKNNTRIVGGREGVICHICIKKYESCYTYSTNIKSRSNIFHVCNACRAKIINSHICDSMQMALEEMYRIHINKQIPMKDTIEYIYQ